MNPAAQIARDECHFDRRRILKGAGVLVVGFRLRPALAATTPDNNAYGPAEDEVDSWLSIGRDGTATLYTGVCELGTGSHTAILQIMAEELDVAFAQTALVTPDTARTPDQYVSSGSRSVANHGIPIRNAAAQARQTLLALAAEHLGAPIDALAVKAGIISVSGRPDRISYGELIGGRRFDVKVSAKIKTKNPSQHLIVGTSVQRIDLPAKFAGKFAFIQDVTVPGMLHGRVVRPPAHGASVLSIDETSLAHLPFSVKLVRKADLVGVVCAREEQAIAAAAALKIVWSEWSGLPATDDLFRTVRAAPEFPSGYPAKAPGGLIAASGDVDAGLAAAAIKLAATYEVPYHHHGSIGPSCAIADVKADRATFWCATQTPYGTRDAAAIFLGLPLDKVRLIWAEGAGCYGQNGADDAAIDALVLSQAVGKPVRVQWMRSDETGWETYKTARISELEAGLDAEGNVIAWKSDAWGFSGYSRPEYHEPHHGGDPGSLVTAQLAGWGKPGLEEGFNGVQLESIPNYTLPAKRVVFHYLGPASHRMGSVRIRVGSMRGVGAPDNIFMVESFMDELAAAAGADPVAFRLRHLSDTRSIALLKAAAEKAGWEPRPAHSAPTRQGATSRGRGVALAGAGDEAHVASIFEVEVNHDTGAIRVPRVTVAMDCGLIVNPDGLKNQIEGGVIQGISRALLEEVRFDRSRVTSTDWVKYPILTFRDVPDMIDITLINRPDLAPQGAGEAPTTNVWPAIVNAVFDATGARIRRLPLTPERVRHALAGI